MKYAVILGDGMADWPIESLGNQTPLDVAKHPCMDRLAQNGLFGLVKTVPDGMKPGSDTANLSVFGYDPKRYYSGRSPLEAMSLGVPLGERDVTYRCNLVTLSEQAHLEGSTMLDYSAGEISTPEAAELVAFLNDALADEGAALYAGFSYRHCLVIKNGITGAVLTQPHDIPNQPIYGKLPRGNNAELLNRWMICAYERLRRHPVNIRRVKEGKRPANGVWFWGEGTKPALPSFYDKNGLRGAVVSAVDLIQGIGCCAGMDVIKVDGATGTYKTNYAAKAQGAINALQNGADYVYVHVEAPDECGHQGQLAEKIHAIERIDECVLRPIWDALEQSGEPYAILLLPDHPTPLRIRTHSADPVPFALYRKGDANEAVVRYCESDAAQTGYILLDGYRLIDLMRQ